MTNQQLMNKYFIRKKQIKLDTEEELLIQYYNKRRAIEKSFGWSYDGTWLKRIDTLTKKYSNKIKDYGNISSQNKEDK